MQTRRTGAGRRPVIAFFDYLDVFEDFFPDYGVDQRTFATRWADSGIHAYLRLLQQNVGDVVWYAFSLKPELETAHHQVVGCTVKFFRSSWMYRSLRWLFYMPRFAWRWEAAYPLYAVLASYSSLLSWSFLRMFLQSPPDFIFVQDYATGRFDTLVLLARALGVPLIAFHTGPVPEEYVGKLAKRWTIRQAHWLIVYSRKESEMLSRRYAVCSKRVKIVLTPLDTEIFRPSKRAEACCKAGLDSSRRYLLFVGRLDDPVKRVSALIRAFAAVAPQHPDVDFLIAGSGPDEEELHQLAQEVLPGRVRFLGWVTPQQKPVLYNVAECLLLASRYEGFPTVVGEAMLCGTPVLASNVGAISELVLDGKTGWLFQAGDDPGLLRLLTEVLSCPTGVMAMRPNVREVAEERLSPRVAATMLRECFHWRLSNGG